MEFSIKEVDLVIERTGCSYQEAKDALLKTDGDVIDAIVLLESRRSVFGNTQFSDFGKKAERTADTVVEKIKSVIAEGNASRLMILDQRGREVTSVSLNTTAAIGSIALIMGAAPLVIISSLVAKYGMNYRFVVEKSDGTKIEI